MCAFFGFAQEAFVVLSIDELGEVFFSLRYEVVDSARRWHAKRTITINSIEQEHFKESD